MPDAAAFNDDERRRLQAQYAEIAFLAGGLAHEIKNPLSTIGLNLELMAEDLGPAETPRDRRLRQRVERVQKECRRLDEILKAFLQFARVGELDRTVSDLNAEVREFIDFFEPHAAEHGIDVSPHLAVDLPPVNIDRALFRQVLLNLALNAQQAMPGGGLLELQTCANGGRVLIELIDNGRGMDAATREKMFQVFFSTKPGGSGLGLPTVRKIIEAHGGTISCESEPGQGTRFTISLPAEEGEPRRF
jgi:signal transduction histidine kinase